MLRNLLIFLVLSNIVYAIWHFYFDESEGAGDFVRTPSVVPPRTLSLASEMGLQERAVGLPDVSLIPEENGCLQLGLYSDLAEAAQATDALQVLGYSSYVSEIEVVQASRFWVLMPPFESEEALQGRVEELEGSGFTSNRINGGELERGLTIGLYDDQDEAESVRQSLMVLGYSVDMREISQSETEVRVVVQGLPNRHLPEPQWHELLDSQANLEVIEKLCETIAP